MSLQDRDRLIMLALGVQGDVPGTSLQPALPDGIHLRWNFGDSEEFPQGGFYLLRRVSNEGDATECAQTSLTRARLTSIVGTSDDVTTSLLALFWPITHGFAEYSSDRFLRLVDFEEPDETFEFDLSERDFLSIDHTASHRVDFTLSLGAPPGTVGGGGGGGIGGSGGFTHSVDCPLPPGTQADQFGVIGTEHLDPRDRTHSDSAIVNMGTQALFTGTDCVFHSIYSRSSVTLNHRTTVSGSVTTGGTLSQLSQVSVGGPVTQNAVFDPPATVTFAVVVPSAPGPDVLLEPDQEQTIAPGRYRHVRVKSRAKLFLSTGAYFVETLEVLEPQAQLVLDETSGPVELVVFDPFAFRGEVISNQPHPELFLLVLNGGGTVRLEAPFRGTLFAPNADLVLGSVPGNIHSGAFCGKRVEIQPDVHIVHHPSPVIGGGTPIPIPTRGTCKVTAWSGEHLLEERAVEAEGLTTGTFRYDHIDRIEISDCVGGGRLVDLCFWHIADPRVTEDWETIAGFTYPLALPVRHPNYGASGGQATDRGASESEAIPRVEYGPGSIFAGSPFLDLHDDFMVPMVQGGPGTMRSVLTSTPGEAEPPDGLQAPQLSAVSLLEIVLLTALNPAMAQLLGLYFRDGTAAAGVSYDYMLVADTTNTFARDVSNLFTFLETNQPQLGATPQFWVTYGVSLESGEPLLPAEGLTGYVLPGAVVDGSGGELVNSSAVAGFLWDLRAGTSDSLAVGAPVSYLLWRAAAGDTPPPSPVDAAAHTVVSTEPQVVALDSLERIVEPAAPDWPPFPLQLLDSGLTDGWYSFRINSIDIFGRHSVLGDPAVWKQWRPAPDPAPYYFDPGLTDDIVHPHALAALDKLAPPTPPGVEAFALDPEDPLVIKDSRYATWFASLSASEQTSLVGLRVRWNWSYSQIRQAPDTVEFRIYHQPGPLNVLSGQITAVSSASSTESLVSTTIAASFEVNDLAGGYLQVGRASYRITANPSGLPLVVTVQNLAINSPMVPPVDAGCLVSVPTSAAGYIDYRQRSSWNERIHVTSYDDAVEEEIVGAPWAAGDLITGVDATASGSTLSVPAGTDLAQVQQYNTHVKLDADTARVNKIYRITDVDGATHQLGLDGSPTLAGGTSAFSIGLYVRRYDVFLPSTTSPTRDGARLETSQLTPLLYANVGVSAADDRPHAADDAGRDGTPFGGRPGNEGTVGGPALIYRVHRGKPDAPLVPPDDEVVFATRANYRAESFYTFRWIPAAGLRTVVLRALDDSVFKNDWLVRTTRSALSATNPAHVQFFPTTWDTAQRQAAAAELNAISSPAGYASLSSDARELLARLPGNEGRVPGGGLEDYDFSIRHTRGSLTEADASYFPPDWTDALRRTTVADELNGLSSLGAYADLRNDSQRVLAGLPGNERAFAQESVDPLDPDDPTNANRVGPDNPEGFPVDPNLRAYVAKLDGKSQNRYFFRARYVDQVENRGPLSLSSPPVSLPDVVPPRSPTFTRVLAGAADGSAGDNKITLRWTSNREPDLADYRVYRSSSADAARDTRMMTLVATVPAPDPAPAEVVYEDSGLQGGVTYCYRVVAVDSSGNASRPSRRLDARAFDTRPPEVPELVVAWVESGGETRAEITWSSSFQVALQSRGPGTIWLDRAPFSPPGSVTFRDENSDPATGHDYRARVRSPIGAVVTGSAVSLGPLPSP